MARVGTITALVVVLSGCPPAAAFESDTHFGLTQWLALQAGFTAAQAEAIALGDDRVDSGDMQYIDLALVYACVGSDDDAARHVSVHHYPTDGPVPGAPASRNVIPGSAAAYGPANKILKTPPRLAGALLQSFGEALHSLQDSWSHQGVADVPNLAGDLIVCDATRAWGHPKSRGGWNSHTADHTKDWPADTLAMAKATFDVLTQYPKIAGGDRSPKRWDQIRPALDGFIGAATKKDKADWFVAHGIGDASFVADTTLKDGGPGFDRARSRRRLPQLTTMESRQAGVDADALEFFSRFFSQWISTADFDAVARAFGAPLTERATRGDSRTRMSSQELAAWLRLWRLRDHGTTTDLAHAASPLSARQIAAVHTLGKAPDAYVRYDAPADALFPLVTNEKDASPLLPFIVNEAKSSGVTGRRLVATAKFRHAPYDTVGVVAEQIDGRWEVISIVSAVDH